MNNETKQNALADLTAGITVKEVAKKHGIRVGTLYGWKSKLKTPRTARTFRTDKIKTPVTAINLELENARLRNLVTTLYLQTQGI